MRFGITLLTLILMSACTAFVVGGGGYQPAKDERASAVITSDSAITTEINSKFAADPMVRNHSIVVRTYKGTVTLTGTVPGAAARDQAGRIAQSAKGATMVNNQIVVDK
ncbi:MAG: BON domain-containing protein [Gammaproteobacteria bacterium]|nr:BON domain-containing protein [Gammaproteobacteria bacterium]